jgi:hypothetical protein
VVKAIDMGAQCVGELEAHMAEPADADDADLLARPHLPVPERRPGGDPGAEQRRDGGELVLAMADVQHEPSSTTMRCE